MNRSKGNWKAGSGCVISDEKPIRKSYDDHSWEIEKDMTGGYIIAESIPTIEDTKLMAAEPELLEACIKALDECCDLICTDAGNALQQAIKKATK